MAITQQKMREVLFQFLYSQNIADNERQDIISFLMAHHEISKKNICQIQERQKVVLEKQEVVDSFIREASHAYDFSRIPQVEKNILRLAVYEICFDDSIPPKVAIAEAIRLARKFATPEGSTFVNAILDAIYKKHEMQNCVDHDAVSRK